MKEYDPKMVSIEQICTWTNHKAYLDNAEDSYERFTPSEIRRHLGVYILNGVAPSPQIEMKFYTQAEEPANGNDACANAFGGHGKASHRHKEFKKYLAFVDPRKVTPSPKVAPNWKVEPLLRHIIHISRQAINIGRWISIDEQTLGFKGRCVWKIRINYKKEGDGFQCDAICADGYTFSFYFQNQAPDPKYVDEGLSPLHSRVALLLSQVAPDKGHLVGSDNLYNSTKFTKFAYVKFSTMLHGVI